MSDVLVELDEDLELDHHFLTEDEYLKSSAAPTTTNTTARASLDLAFTMATTEALRRSGRPVLRLCLTLNQALFTHLGVF